MSRGPLPGRRKTNEARARAGGVIVEALDEVAGAAHLADLQRLDRAVGELRAGRPDLSAAEPIWKWQQRLALALAVALAIGVWVAPRLTLIALLAVLTVPFFCVVVLKGTALWHTLSTAPGKPADPPSIDDASLPTYSILVPLFREANVVPDLLEALAKIDYPAAKLEILLIVEGVDADTRAALATTPLTAQMRIVTVPDGQPRTKPRALNYALAEASGKTVVVFDAEDMPEPDQLRRAASMLASAANVGCVQARLNVYNPRSTWLAGQFTIEYTALFDCLLPTLERFRLPVPLGGTSNHFPRAILDRVGGWDPYNVTEDADLGIRLARMGWHVAVLESTTWEEAPSVFGVWLRQRTRWLKGWMQTYLVHMRDPIRLFRELGMRRFLGLQILMGGVILSALVHPWFYVFALVEALYSIVSLTPGSLGSHVLWWVGVFNLISGYLTGVALGWVAVVRRGNMKLAGQAFLMPAYWLLISAAAYRALAQLISKPYLWEKTEHSARTRPE
jgi:cellulose synthase/poly-beta-1,6-N-acetylglucosamine synthase-like glycosyltransferase